MAEWFKATVLKTVEGYPPSQGSNPCLSANPRVEDLLLSVLLVDDHLLVRAGLKQILATVKGIRVVAEVDSGEQVLAIVKKESVDVIVMDTRLPGLGSLETCRRLLLHDADCKIVMLAESTEEVLAARFLQLGVTGYLTRSCSIEEFSNTIRKAALGQRYITADVAQQLALRHVGEVSPLERLSERELQILEMITHAKSVQEIADLLYLSPKTVNSHRYRLFAKLQIESDVALTHLALRWGLLTDLHLHELAKSYAHDTD